MKRSQLVVLLNFIIVITFGSLFETQAKNIALLSPVTASSYSTLRGAHLPELAVDGDWIAGKYMNSWAANYYDSQPWIEINFEEMQTIEKIRLKGRDETQLWGNDLFKDIDIYFSDGSKISTTLLYTRDWQEIKVDNIISSSIKIVGLTTYNAERPGFNEIEVYQPENDDLIRFPDNMHWYSRNYKLRNWDDSRNYCDALGGHLATVTNQAENDFIFFQIIHEVRPIWIGGTDDNQEGSWEWVTGEPWDYTNWTSGEPDNKNGQNFLAFSGISINSWCDDGLPSLDSEFSYICEWEHIDDLIFITERTDIDRDKDIDGDDLSLLVNAFGSDSASANYNLDADINEDGKVDHMDLTSFSYMYAKNHNSIEISGCKYIRTNESLMRENLLQIDGTNCYDFSLNDPTTISILSTGNLDLKSDIYKVINGKKYPIDADNDGIIDEGDKRISNEFTDSDNVIHNNFMLRPGAGGDGEKRILPPGHYRFIVSFDDDAELVDENYGIILLKTSETQQERIADFFEGLRTIVQDDGGYEENDYLDIYVRALFNDIYDGNWHAAIDYNGVPAERQCKALPNFYVSHIFGQNQFLFSDCTIDKNFSMNNPDYVLQGSATTVYNKMADPIYGDEVDALRGDVWVQDISLVCDEFDEWLSGYNHYGLYIDDTSIIDANWSEDGRLQIAPTRSQDKVVRPE